MRFGGLFVSGDGELTSEVECASGELTSEVDWTPVQARILYQRFIVRNMYR